MQIQKQMQDKTKFTSLLNQVFYNYGQSKGTSLPMIVMMMMMMMMMLELNWAVVVNVIVT